MEKLDASARRRTYAEWYVWSRRNLTNNTEICHAAAQAATEAIAAGSDPATAARGAAQNRAGAGWMTNAEPSVRGYAEWYDWSRTNLLLSGEPLHAAATAAIQVMDGGGDAAAAADAARHSTGGQPGGAQPGPQPAPVAAIPPPMLPQPAPAGWDQAQIAPPPPPPAPAPLPPPTPPIAPPYGYAGTPAPAATGPVILPVWVAILLGVGCGMSLLPGIVFVVVLFTQTDPQTTAGAIGFSVLFLLIFTAAVLALVGIVRRASWARAMAIVAGVAFCLSCVGILLGVPVIVGAATAGGRS